MCLCAVTNAGGGIRLVRGVESGEVGGGGGGESRSPIWCSLPVSLPRYSAIQLQEQAATAAAAMATAATQPERDRAREELTPKRGSATTGMVQGQQCHNYFQMSAYNKIQQFIWQKAN